MALSSFVYQSEADKFLISLGLKRVVDYMLHFATKTSIPIVISPLRDASHRFGRNDRAIEYTQDG
ncbi:MAG: hypothetical protein A2167_00685 [Planctomycetes bacterium RBG_13_46_10]|nr:MAG: hypothetical protein A2167_00685 [Planctomycetes bacterium RBG_13_46_10]